MRWPTQITQTLLHIFAQLIKWSNLDLIGFSQFLTQQSQVSVVVHSLQLKLLHCLHLKNFKCTRTNLSYPLGGKKTISYSY